jgi:hypothetical protein
MSVTARMAMMQPIAEAPDPATRSCGGEPGLRALDQKSRL